MYSKINLFFMLLFLNFSLGAEETKNKNYFISIGNQNLQLEYKVLSKGSFGISYFYNSRDNDLAIRSSSDFYYDPGNNILIPTEREEFRSRPEWNVFYKYFPFSFDLFFGIQLGTAYGKKIEYQESFFASYSIAQNRQLGLPPGYNTNVEFQRSPYLGLFTGYRFVFDSGLFLGLEAGLGWKEQRGYLISHEPSSPTTLLLLYYAPSQGLPSYLIRDVIRKSEKGKDDAIFPIYYFYFGYAF
jgi:hypothetical protein